MKKRITLFLVSALLIACIFAFAAYATESEASLWSQKPTDTTNLVHSGYCLDKSGANTNIKFEVYNEGTTDAPEYTIYFFMEDKNGGSVVYPGRNATNASGYGYDATTDDTSWNCGMSSGRAGAQAWYANDKYNCQLITKAVFGDGITELGGTAGTRGILTCLQGLTTVEFPASLTKMVSATFESCKALKTVYTRDVGQTAEEGTVNLSNFTHMNFATYAFACCQKVQKYVFAETITTDTPTIGSYCFGFSSSLKSINIPVGITEMSSDVFYGSATAGTWSYCKIEEITIHGTDTAISASTFSNCNNLTTIKAPADSLASEYAAASGYTHVEIEAPEVTLPIDTVTSTCGALIMTYDPNTKTMTVDTESISWTPFVPAHWWNSGNGSVHCAEPVNFMQKYKTEVEHFVIGSNIDELAIGDSTYSKFFDGFTALKTVRFTNKIKLTLGSTGNLFANCTNLTSVYVGDESNAEEGVADLSSFTGCDSGVLLGLFTNCTSIKKVLLPVAAGAASIYSSTFEGCTALETVSIPANITAIAADAFADCTALTTIIAPDDSVGYNYGLENGLLATLWSQKPTDDTNLVHSGYCLDYYGAKTNIKFEIYNEGTADAPSYTMYFSMVDKSGSSVVLPGAISATADSPKWIYINSGNNGRYGVANHQAYYASDIYDTQYIHKVVFGDGITALGCSDSAAYSGILSGLNGLKTVELPASLERIYDATFKACHKFKTVYTRDIGQKIVVGTVNLSNLKQVYLGKYAFSACFPVEHYVFHETMLSGQHIDAYCFNENNKLVSLNLPDSAWSVVSTAFNSCGNLEAIYAPVGTKPHTFAMANGYDTTHYSIFEDEDGSQVKLEYFPSTQHMSITRLDTSYVEFLWNDATVQIFLTTYKGLVKTADVGSFQKIRGNGESEFSGLFENFTALTEVHFDSLVLTPYWGCTEVDLFKNCSALTTVWVGDDSNKIDGVINLTGFTKTDSYPELVLKGMFSGCTAIKKVILPDLVIGSTATVPTIHANTFENCTDLEEIVIPASYGAIEDGAFGTCTSLRKIDLNSTSVTLSGAAFTGCSNVIIYCADKASADAINTTLTADGIQSSVAIAFSPAMDILGFQVRETDYNGLRARFAFDETLWNGKDGFTLVEYGSIVASEANYSKYDKYIRGENPILTIDSDGNVNSAADSIVKTAIWNAAEGYDGAKSNHSTNSNVLFNTTIVKYFSKDQYMTDVAMVGYEVYEKNGEYFAFFTEYDSTDYSTLSLYKVTIGMLAAAEAPIFLVKGNNPIYAMLADCEPTALVTDNASVEGMLLSDPINSGKYVALYATDSETEVTFSDLGSDEGTRDNITATVFGTNVVYALPELDAVWADYMDAKIEEIPEGKSFVFITDTHWENNAKNSTALIDYVRKATGITNVVYGGDPFDGFTSLTDAQNALTTYAQTNFYDVFGEDGIYVVGNHDVNNTESQGAAELTISDTFLYNTTVKNIENKAVFDTDMLTALESITYAEVQNTDGSVAYTADQMKEQALAWAKMHYHYDNTADKIRYIVLDTGTNGITQLNTIHGNYTSFMSIEYDWLAKTLLSTPADYDIVVLGHQIGERTANNTAQRDLFQILSAFKAKTTLTLNLTSHSANTLAIMGGSTARTYNFTTSTFEGTIFSMNGHWHYDRSWIWQTELGTYGTNQAYSDDLVLSDDAILSICCNRDAMWSVGELTMTVDTTTEQSFNVVTITDDGKIVLTRFGAGESQTFIYA